MCGRTWALIEPGVLGYDEALALQMSLVGACRKGLIGAALVVLEHLPVITLGKSSRPDEAAELADRIEGTGVQVASVNRGGKATYHGPGQLVAYPITRLMSHQVVTYVRSLEQAAIDTLGHFGIRGTRREGHPGAWVQSRKIASIGIAVSGGVAYHGMALNVCTDMSYFSLIQPCGLTAADMVSMEEAMGRPIGVAEVKQVFLGVFSCVMGAALRPVNVAPAGTELAVPGVSSAK